MPYTTESPPDRIKDLPKHAQEIWIAAYNSAMDQDKDEQTCNQIAFAAVKRDYEQDSDGNWTAKKSGPEYFNFKTHFKAKEKDEDLFIEGYASVFEEDLDGETVDPKAFDGMLDAFSTNPVILADHENDTQKAVGRVVDWRLDKIGLWVKVLISNAKDEYTQMIRTKVKEGILNSFSIGGLFEKVKDTITKVLLLHIAITPQPANPYCRFALSKAIRALNINCSCATPCEEGKPCENCTKECEKKAVKMSEEIKEEKLEEKKEKQKEIKEESVKAGAVLSAKNRATIADAVKSLEQAAKALQAVLGIAEIEIPKEKAQEKIEKKEAKEVEQKELSKEETDIYIKTLEDSVKELTRNESRVIAVKMH